MASAIFHNGRRINRPGAYSEVDASALATLSPSPTGIVALIGTAVGGKPLDVSVTEADHTRSDTVLKKYLSGDLRVAGQFAFQPSKEEGIGGAQKLVCIKVNPATQSTVTLDDADGNDAMTVSSRDYGLHTTQINIAVAAGTTLGKKLTVIYEDKTETFDDVGGTGILSLLYTAGSSGYGTCTLAVSSTQTTVTGVRTSGGLDTQRAADMPAPGFIEVLSANVADTTQTVTIYGITNLGAAAKVTLALNGTTVVEDATTTFAHITGARLSAVTAGNVTVRTADGVTTLITFTAGQTTRGLLDLTNAFFMGTGTLAIDVVSANSRTVVRGVTAAGQEVAVMLDSSASTSQSLATAMASVVRLTHIELADVPAARTVTVTSTVVLLHASFSTPKKQVDRLNALSGLTATAIVNNPTTFLMTDCDRESAASILGVTVTIYADLFYCIDKLNKSSAYVSATRATPGAKKPANAAAQFLTGGIEGTPTITEWSQAFALLRKRRVNIIVPLTNDAAVHALLFSHCVDRAGRLRSEANGYVGIGTNDGAGETQSNIKSQIRALNTRHIAAISEECQRFDPDTGEATWYPPYIYAAIAAGMQAGAPIGTPLTKKKPDVLDVRRDSSWTVEDDAEDMIDSGLMFTEVDDEKGIRWERSITTHLADDNVVFCESSANAAMNYAIYEFRRRLELMVGKKGVGGSVASIKGLAAGVLAELIDDEIIVAWQGLQVEQIADSFPVAVEMSPVLPINFIPITVHVTAVRVAA